MSYTRNFVFNLGASNAGLTTRVQLMNTAGTDVGGELRSVVALGGGSYMLDVSIPDDHRGAIKIYENGSPGTPLVVIDVQPESSENDDTEGSTILAAIQAVEQEQEIEVNVGHSEQNVNVKSITNSGTGDTEVRTGVVPTNSSEEVDVRTGTDPA
jgi:hypothetical protein